jgi:hypothetical protein
MSPKPKGTNGEHPPHATTYRSTIAIAVLPRSRMARPRSQTRKSKPETHKAALAEFRKQVGERHPQLGVETGLMAVDGTMQIFT